MLFPFALAALIFLYFTWEVDEKYMWFLLASMMMTVVIYLLGPQIDWWWFQRKPPELPAPLRHILNTRFPFYQKLSAENKTRFRNRMALYMEANEFIAKGTEQVPVDVKGALAATVVWLTFGLKDYRLGKFEHIVIYPHPFPSPQYPEKWHASEIFEEDGVMLFSAEQLMPAFFEPGRYFHTGMYEYAKAFMRCYPAESYPSLSQPDWGKLERISGFSREILEKWIGLPDIDVLAVAITHFFVFPEKFKAEMPEIHAALSKVFQVS